MLIVNEVSRKDLRLRTCFSLFSFVKEKPCFYLLCVSRGGKGRVFLLLFFLSKFAAGFAGIFLLLFSFNGCATKTPERSTGTTQTRTITDDLGKTVTLPERVERAVSLAPSLTESIFAVGGGSRLVGVTTFCNYPAEASSINKVGDTINPNLEAIIALKPQVVFVSTASQIESFTNSLQQQGIAVFVTNPNDVDSVYKSLEQIGDIFGEKTKADELVNSLKARTEAIAAKVSTEKPVLVFVQISKEPLFTIGKSSFVTDLITRAGGSSVTSNIGEAYPKFSKETALALQPEAIILSDSEDNREPNDVFGKSPAVRGGKIFRVNADLISRPGPRMFDALEQLAAALHPEKFSKP
jgi:iron complex transport system substrate-binding protein